MQLMFMEGRALFELRKLHAYVKSFGFFLRSFRIAFDEIWRFSEDKD